MQPASQPRPRLSAAWLRFGTFRPLISTILTHLCPLPGGGYASYGLNTAASPASSTPNSASRNHCPRWSGAWMVAFPGLKGE